MAEVSKEVLEDKSLAMLMRYNSRNLEKLFDVPHRVHCGYIVNSYARANKPIKGWTRRVTAMLDNKDTQEEVRCVKGALWSRKVT
ncbi:hypothetical protein SJAG_03610 [Schizosaccharomyces japonicus yFS275]|uniref:Uncharacterized protein n=1 Tax=Schizosaccharomyces japonicus (strain yFS275 / FY16936) TaxID=402676 RepID=B6K4P8_SCHJY|nr:hypothetical protein SJAG_03610 [Schizosaccharomyces japonicus yFS275]EEB08455.1 hypothetical protein SJAG_03610 [Schizosaccharomyces japonicus yFS275]